MREGIRKFIQIKNKDILDIKSLFASLYQETISILTHPKRKWVEIKNGIDEQPISVSEYFVVGLVILFLSVALGTIMFKSDGGILWIEVFTEALRKTAMMVLAYFSSLFWIYELLRLFKQEPTFKHVRLITIYSFVPVLVMTALTGLFPFLGMIGVVGLYGFVLLYLGLQTFFKIEKETAISFYAILLLVLLVNAWLVLFVITKLVGLFIY